MQRCERKQQHATRTPYNKLTDSIRQQPQNAGLYYRRGALLYQNSQLPAAATDLKRAWQLQPTEEHALSVATVLLKTNQDSALHFIKQALQSLPGALHCKLVWQEAFSKKGNLQQALATCDQVLVLYPNSIDALLLKTEIYKNQTTTQQPLQTLEKAYSYAPFDHELAYNLAFEYAEAKNSKAIPLTDSLMRSDTTGKQAQPYYLRGVYYANTGNIAQALQYYNQAIAHDYNFYDAYMDKGALLYEVKQYNEALAVFQLVNRITPTYAGSYYWAGRCHQAMGNKAEAKLAYQRAYGLDKNCAKQKKLPIAFEFGI
jgi:tetratricopeptide (TPR) repeat protein